MKIDFGGMPLEPTAFSAAPMTFLNPHHRAVLADLAALIAVETGERGLRESWQAVQLRNLLTYVHDRSPFWRARLPADPRARPIELSALPVLDKRALRRQVAEEGALLTERDNNATRPSQTSGSSGEPITFHWSAMNGAYNNLRTVAQYFMEDRDFSWNRIQVTSSAGDLDRGYKLTSSPTWADALQGFVRTGTSRTIDYTRPDMGELLRVIMSEPIGYMVTGPWAMDALLQHCDEGGLRDHGMGMWIPRGGAPDEVLASRFRSAGIAVRAMYSAQEVGLIGAECLKCPGVYHVATSNVLVESVPIDGLATGGGRPGRLLITHLHSYATPFIRYDIGDLGVVDDRCACGHDGPVVSQVVGRDKSLFRRTDGGLSPFLILVRNRPWLSDYEEYRFRQVAVDRFTVDVGGRPSLTADEVARFEGLVKEFAGAAVQVEVRAVQSIDWGRSAKRLAFTSEVV